MSDIEREDHLKEEEITSQLERISSVPHRDPDKEIDKLKEEDLIAELRRMSTVPRRDPDVEWINLFEFQKQYRKYRQITAEQLLVEMKLPINLTQYLYAGSRVFPSTRSGTLGKSLRDNLNEIYEVNNTLKQSPSMICEENNMLNQSPNKLFLLESILEEKRFLLEKCGVLTIYLDKDKNFVVCTAEEKFNKNEFLEIIAEFNLNSTSIKYTETIACAYFRSPMCTKSNVGFGTSSVVLTKSGLLGITAKHTLVNQPMEAEDCIKVDALQHQCESVRYSPNASTCTIGYALKTDIHATLDIALFHPLSNHSYCVNMFSADHTFSMDKDELFNFNFANSPKVYKYGVASGLTCGVIDPNSLSPPYFWVNSTEIGDFGMRGDSGSLIICSTTKLAVGVLSRFERENKQVMCVMLQYLYELEVLLDC
jgi:hypothetical protein